MKRPFRVRGWVPLAAIPTKVMPNDKPAVPADTRSETEKLADFYYDKMLREDAAKKAEEERIAREQRDERLRREQEANNQRREAEFHAAEFQITAVFDQYGLSESERTQIEDAITLRQLWAQPMKAVEFATVQAMEIATKRPKPLVIPYGMVEVTDEDF